jgi:hypothetical protein
MQTKNIIRVAIVTVLLLLVPLVAMQFNHDIVWSPFDFAVAGTLLFGAGLAYVFLANKSVNIVHRAAVALAVATALFLVWSNLAVGLIGSEKNPDNLMYLGVIAVAIVGALIARFRPHGMARALFATALAQALVAVIALALGMHHSAESSVSEILGINAFFVALFVVSGFLFQRASTTPQHQ